MPDFFGDKRHNRMQEPYRGFKQADQIPASQLRSFFVRVFSCQTRLDQLNVPVAQFSPEEIVNCTSRIVETKCFQCLAHLLSNSIEAREDPAIFQCDCLETCDTRLRRRSAGIRAHSRRYSV